MSYISIFAHKSPDNSLTHFQHKNTKVSFFLAYLHSLFLTFLHTGLEKESFWGAVHQPTPALQQWGRVLPSAPCLSSPTTQRRCCMAPSGKKRLLSIMEASVCMYILSPSHGPHALAQISLGLAEIISVQEGKEEPLGFLWINISAHVHATLAAYGCTSQSTSCTAAALGFQQIKVSVTQACTHTAFHTLVMLCNLNVQNCNYQRDFYLLFCCSYFTNFVYKTSR